MCETLVIELKRENLAARVQEAKSNYVHGLTKSGGLKELMEDMAVVVKKDVAFLQFKKAQDSFVIFMISALNPPKRLFAPTS